MICNDCMNAHHLKPTVVLQELCIDNQIRNCEIYIYIYIYIDIYIYIITYRKTMTLAAKKMTLRI